MSCAGIYCVETQYLVIHLIVFFFSLFVNTKVRGFCDDIYFYRARTGRGKTDPVPKLVTGAFGAIAGAASVFGNTPLDVVKTRMQVNKIQSCDIFLNSRNITRHCQEDIKK